MAITLLEAESRIIALETRCTQLENSRTRLRRIVQALLIMSQGEVSVDKAILTGPDLDIYITADENSGYVRVGIGKQPQPYVVVNG